MNGDQWMALLLSLVPVAVLWRGFRRVDEQYLRRWSDRFGPTLDDETRPRIAAALRRGRRLRAVGAAIGLVVGALPAYLNLVAPERASDFAGPVTGLAWVFGAALGATVAEAAFVQRPTGRREATLDRRRWQEYVARRSVLAVATTVVLAAGGALVAVVQDTDEVSDAVLLAAAAVLAGVALVGGLRRIVRRPRLSLEPRWRVVDEALRADGANRLTGAALAVAGCAAMSSVSIAAWELFPPLGLLAGLAYNGFLIWWWVLARDVVWRVDRQPAPA